MESNNGQILFFDGVCNLCNGLVDFMIQRQKTPHIFFAPLQGKTAKLRLPPERISDLDTVVYQRKNKTYTQSSAVLWAVSDLNILYKFILLGLVIPAPLRNIIYSWVAQNRYRLFGKSSSCRLPTPEERAYFLD